ncbi:MAG: FIST signal transduction protein [Nannocystales bacterium]
MDIASIGPLDVEPEQVRRAFEAVADRLEGRKLGFLYLPHDVDAGPLLKAACDGLGDRVVGATTGGAAFTERGFTRDGVVGGVIGGSGFDYSVAVAHDLSPRKTQRLEDACGELVVAARKSVSRVPALLALGDGRSIDGVALTETLSRSLPPHWRIFGGTAGDSLVFEDRSRVFVDGEVLDGAAVLVGLFSDSNCGVAVGHGWSAVQGAKELAVSEIDGHNLIGLDGRPAAEVFGEELHRLGLVPDPAVLVPDASRYQFGARSRFGELTVRAALEFPGDGSIRLAGGVTLGTVLQVVATTPERLAESASEVGRRAVAEFPDGRTPRGGLVFDCAGRLAYLEDAYPSQLRGFFAGHAFPVVGVTSYGEIAKFGGSLEGFHNATAVMAAW